MHNSHSLFMLNLILNSHFTSLIMTLTTVCYSVCECTHVRLCLTFRLFLVGALGFEDSHPLPSPRCHCDSQRPKP